MLAAENIEFVGSAYPSVGHGYVDRRPRRPAHRVDRVVALPCSTGAGIPGVPADGTGFIPVDAHGRVPHLDRVYAAGDGTNFPIKQGGLATQQADAVAEAIAAEAGADIDPEPFRPVLRGLLLTGGDDRYLRHAVAGGGGEPELAGHALWWPPTKIAGRYISGYLFESDETQMLEDIRAGHLEVHLPLDAHARRRASLDDPHALPAIEVCGALGVDAGCGLSEAEAARRLARDGRNELRHEPPPSRLALLARQFVNSMVLLLVGAAAISLAIGELLDAARDPGDRRRERAVRRGQEGRADKAAAAVRALLAPTARVAPRRVGCASGRPRTWCPATSSPWARATACRRTAAWSRRRCCRSTSRR